MPQLTVEQLEGARHYHRQRTARRYLACETERLAWLAQTRNTICTVASSLPALSKVYIFGSLMQPGRFHADSDLDIAVECADLESESNFWRCLEQKLQRAVDVRPMVEPIRSEVFRYGELIYERENPCLDQQH